MPSQKLVLALGLLLTGTAIAFTQDMRPPINADDVKWGPVPPNIPAGAQLAVISGDPSKEGLYVIRLKMPGGYKVPAHNHPQYENVTVLSGEFNVGMGDKLDTEKGMLLRPGGYVEAQDAPLRLGDQRYHRADCWSWAVWYHLRRSSGRS
jgi:quercetin dioxygenase-like cupin family protein